MSILKLILSSIMDSWLRNLLLMMSVVIAYTLFGTLFAFERAYSSTNSGGDSRIISANKISFTQPLPLSHFRAVQALENIEATSFAAWFGGFYQEPRNRLHTIAVDPTSYLAVYGDDLSLSEDERASFLGKRNSMLVGEKMAQRFGWRVGDQIPIINQQIARTDGDNSWTFQIAGVVRGATAYVDTNFVYIHYNLLNETRLKGRDTIGWIVTQPSADADPGRLGEEIDELFVTSAQRTTTDSERSFAQTFVAQFGDLALVTVLILGAAFFSLLVIVGSTTTLAIQQRIREVGILKGLGFSHSRILSIFIGESVLVVLFSGMLGLFLANLLVTGAESSLTSIAPGIAVSATMAVVGVLTMLLLAIAASAWPAVRAVNTAAANALRRN